MKEVKLKQFEDWLKSVEGKPNNPMPKDFNNLPLDEKEFKRDTVIKFYLLSGI